MIYMRLFGIPIMVYILLSGCTILGGPADCVSRNCFCKEKTEVVIYSGMVEVGRTWVDNDCPQPMFRRGGMTEEYIE